MLICLICPHKIVIALYIQTLYDIINVLSVPEGWKAHFYTLHQTINLLEQ